MYPIIMHVSNYKLPLYYLLGFTVDPLTGFYRELSGRVWLGERAFITLTTASNMIIYSTGKDNGLKCKLGPQCGESIQKLAAAPRFLTYGKPSGRVWLRQ